MRLPCRRMWRTVICAPATGGSSGARNPSYTGVYVFDNDHPCVGPLAPRVAAPAAGIYRNRPAAGIARVVCYSPRHDLTLAELELPEVDRLLEVWQEQYRGSGRTRRHRSRARVREQGGSRRRLEPPPALPDLRDQFRLQDDRDGSGRWRAAPGRARVACLFQDVLAAEQADGRRIICENDSAIAFVPYFARYAYEVFVAPKATHPSLAALSAAERRDLAAVLQEVLVRFDNLWQMPFPYVMPLHQAPTDGRRVSGLPLPHRVPSAAPQTQSAEVPGRAGDRRWQLPERHGAGREGRRAADSARRPLQEGTVTAASDRLQR